MLKAEERLRDACKEIAARIVEQGVSDRQAVERLKLEVAERYGLNRVPSNLEILGSLPDSVRDRVARVLAKKPVKTISGVTVVTVVAPIYECPHGRCIYCPGGPSSRSPRSYTGAEEAVRRARSVSYDPYLQVSRQVERLESMGHVVDKVELIFIGGTFNAMPTGFQRWFIKRCIDALNGRDSSSLEEALQLAEMGVGKRISGITVETKPDWVKPHQANRLLEMGVTRVELGVQALDDELYRLNNRGHTLQDVVEATRTLKDLAFKVCYHLMPNLPGSTVEKDLEMYRMLWEDERFRPDMLKIYPTLVLPGTVLHEWWMRGRHRVYSDEELVRLLAEWFLMTPPYVRIQRVQREIPLEITSSGNRVANLREVVENYLRSRGLRCRCIRCREAGHRLMRDGVRVDEEKVRLKVIRYRASGGEEFFISYEDVENDVLVGFIRLRDPSQTLRPEIRGAALIRELHVYGVMTPVGEHPRNASYQHRSYGSRLLSEAERIAVEELDARKVVVISGVGVRRYYYSHGYRREGPYVSKLLKR